MWVKPVVDVNYIRTRWRWTEQWIERRQTVYCAVAYPCPDTPPARYHAGQAVPNIATRHTHAPTAVFWRVTGHACLPPAAAYDACRARTYVSIHTPTTYTCGLPRTRVGCRPRTYLAHWREFVVPGRGGGATTTGCGGVWCGRIGMAPSAQPCAAYRLPPLPIPPYLTGVERVPP